MFLQMFAAREKVSEQFSKLTEKRGVDHSDGLFICLRLIQMVLVKSLGHCTLEEIVCPAGLISIALITDCLI